MADERDPKVSQRYRELGGEEPSRELDQTILAAAHRAAGKPHAPLVTPAGRHRWYFSLAAAAILLLAVAVTVHVEREQPDPEAGAAAPVPSAPKEDFYYKKEAPPAAMEQRRETERAEPRKRVEPPKPQPPKPQPGLTPDPAPVQEAPQELARDATPAGPPVAESRVQEDAARAVAPPEVQSREAAPVAKPDLAPAPQAARAPQAKPAANQKPMGQVAASAFPLSPERLLERIAELRKEGRHNEADQMLAEFRQRYPDYRIPKEMLEKVERKK